MHDFSPLDSGAPRQITPRGPADHFEVLTRAVCNAGLRWQVVHNRWPAFAEVFADFDPEVVAGYDEHDVERLLADDRLIRSRGKLSAIPVNARTFVGLAEQHDDFAAWLRDHDGYDARERALRRHFRYIGEFGAYWAMYTWRDDVPDYREWAEARGRTLPEHLQ